jgi:predicted transcriptional regulator
MKERDHMKPTKAELEILQALWKLGPATVRQVHEEIGRKTGYTTVLKLMQILHEKGLVAREEAGRAHVYKPCVSEQSTMSEFMRELVARVFDGSPARLVMQALGVGKTSREELAKIRSLIDELERKQK